MLVNTLLGSLAAKLALGVGLATATMTAAGAAGVLPDAAQHAVASVVDATTPFSVPDTSTLVPQVHHDTTASNAVAGATDADEAAGHHATVDDGDGTHAVNHGTCVSTAAKSLAGTGAGKTISSIARSDCGRTEASTSTTSTTVAGSTSTSTSTTLAGAENRSANSGSGSAHSGKGSTAGNGKGNAGKN